MSTFNINRARAPEERAPPPEERARAPEERDPALKERDVSKLEQCSSPIPLSVFCVIGKPCSPMSSSLKRQPSVEYDELSDEKYRAVVDEYRKNVEDSGGFVRYSGGFVSYNKELEAGCDEPLQNALLILQFPKTNVLSQRDKYNCFVKHLEEAARKYNSLSICGQRLVKILCYGRFFNTEIPNYLNKCLEGIGKVQSSSRVELKDFEGKFRVLNNTFTSEPLGDSVWETFNFGTRILQAIGSWRKRASGAQGRIKFSKNNTPHVRGTSITADGREIVTVRHGRPTTYGKSGQEIDPEYKIALKEAEEKNEGVLYVNHQKTFGGSAEKVASNLLFDLENNHPNFFCLSQSFDSHFFKGPNKQQPTLINNLISEFMEECSTGLNRLPSILSKDPTYKEELEQLLIKSMLFLFPNGQVTTKEERQNFILLAYSVQKEHLKKYLSVDTDKTPKEFPVKIVAGVCKDDLDRGGSMGMVESLLQILLLNITSEEKEKLYFKNMTATIVPCWIVRKTGALMHRIEPGLSVARHLSQLTLENTKQLRDLFKEHKILVTELSFSKKIAPSVVTEERASPEEVSSSLAKKNPIDSKSSWVPSLTSAIMICVSFVLLQWFFMPVLTDEEGEGFKETCSLVSSFPSNASFFSAKSPTQGL